MSGIELDLLVSCPECQALIGEPCSVRPLVHFRRRLDRLLLERGATMADLEEAVKNNTPPKGNRS